MARGVAQDGSKRTANPAEDPLRLAEVAGLKLAIIGRSIALCVVLAWFLLAGSPMTALYGSGLVLVFLLLGWLQYRLLGTARSRPWMKYALFSLDISLLGLLVAFGPLSYSDDIPQILAFRVYGPYYPLIILPLAALTLSPGLLLWCGGMIVAVWLGAFGWVVLGMERTVSWADLPPGPSAEQYLAVFLDPDFIGAGNRIEESMFILLTAGLLALAVHRARRVVIDLANSEAARQRVADAFGRFLPETIVAALAADPGALAPRRGVATILFLDIQGFTTLVEQREPEEVFAFLDLVLSRLSDILARHGGVITNIQGDAVLATFNLPLPKADHAASALAAAREIVGGVHGSTVMGRIVQLRIGINTGSVAAGGVGGHRRQTYTVHGDTVNVAARLEALNKELGTVVLFGEATRQALIDTGHDVSAIIPRGSVVPRGRSGGIAIYTIAI